MYHLCENATEEMLRSVSPTKGLLKFGTLSKNLIWVGFSLSSAFNEKVIP